MYLVHNEAKSVIAERLIKTLKTKIYKIVTANDNKSYLSYLNTLVDQYNILINILLISNLLLLIILP